MIAVIADPLLALFATVVHVAQSRETAKHEPAAQRARFVDVAPIFNSKCIGCHMAGGIAPFSLTDANQARTHAALIEIMTHAGAYPRSDLAAGRLPAGHNERPACRRRTASG